ncbi:acyl-CoA dehydrogenase family protein [uncultured Modestobacter sp.]|uniref:acyl-CoA dehydrogenase family protein n=1 Tax=uncultured Modestobacter sp. TaxID=380048 RepID=UPI00261F05DE|nr:acyl-CoA dehydrogenase family protein [uncultured Modestobacter sp.]
MDLLPSADQQDVVRAAADFLAQEMPRDRIRQREAEASSVDAAAWTGCADLGLFGLSVPEELGGAGFGVEEEALLFRELGRHVAPGPFLSTVLAAQLAVAIGDADLVASIVAGKTTVGLAALRAGSTVDEDRVRGDLDLIDAVEAPLVLLLGPAGAALVETGQLGAVQTVPSIDPGVRLATATGVDAPVSAWLPAATRPLYLRGLVLAAALLVGIAEACRDASTEYAKTREQFGRPIGVNQAVKHRCADMAVQAELGMAQLYFAAVSLASGRPDAELQARTAKVVAAHAATVNAASNVQVHGGMGYTWENDAHLFVKRVEVLENLLGGRTEHLAEIVALPAPQ